MLPVWRILRLLAVAALAISSEFPERECCDPTTTERTTIASSQTSTLTGSTGPNTKTTIAILNCLLARQLCYEDASCSAILEIIPRVCGPEVVACSTVTVTKCQAALRTLQAFPFFKPTCLCREPHMDPECNSFRDFLFDHPCVFVMKKEKDPYPVDALPTCTHAHFVCQQEHKCIKLYEEFKANCKVRDSKCRMDDRDLCYKSWTNLRLSPMFGCICPNNHMKKRCDRIFSMVNHNPCVDSGTGTGTAAITSTNTKTSTTPIDPLVDDNSLPPLKPFSNYDVPAELWASDNATSHYGDEIGNSLLSNPLVDSVNGEDAYVDYNHISVNVLKNRDKTFHSHAERQYPEDDDDAHAHTSGIGQASSKHPVDTGVHLDPEKDNVVFQSTCHLAMANCNSNYQCRMLLAPILHHCDVSHCNRNSCMEALQTFYGKPDFHWNVEIAFCLCKKTENKHDPCLIAQEKLHPVCAQRMEETPQPTCLHLAELCRENKECRNKLEYFEQSCAVDSVTKKCAGSPADCRKSILEILGTDLRTTCACRGTDMAQLYECLGWQRLLWVNPCVVEAQKQFHMQRSKQEQTTTTTTTAHSYFQKTSTKPTTTTTTTTTTIVPRTTVHVTPASKSVTEASVKIVTTIAEFLPPPQPFIPTSTGVVFIPVTAIGNRVTTVKMRKTTVTTSTAPPRSCVVQRPQFSDQFIREGTLKRIYHEDEFECSDVCECEIGEKLSCRTICIDRMPCKTEFAFYNHAAPAYQAFRGRCLCYSGRFICVKPAPVDYTLPQGIYLFLGYSEVDEKEINKNQSAIVIQDVVRVLQSFIRKEAVNGTNCNLELYNSTKENIILQVKLSEEVYDYSKLSPKEILIKEKEECAELLELISDKINSRDTEFVSHLLLSVFKMAEVEIVQIEPVSSAKRYISSIRLPILLTLVIFIVHITQNFCISS